MNLSRLIVPVLSAGLVISAQFPDFTPPTPLIGAAMSGNTAEVKRLLAAGANPNDGRFVGGGTPLLYSLMNYHPDMAEALIAKGADVKATDAVGSTALLWAAYNDAGDTAIAAHLLQLGVDPNARNKKGETALDWAMRRGNTPLVDLLRKSGASDSATLKQSVEKALALLQKSGPEFVKVSGCTSCHNQSLPQMAYSFARERGMAVNAQISQHEVKAVVAMFKPITEQMASLKVNIPDPAISVSYSLVGLAAEGYAPDATTSAMATLVASQQQADGSFLAFPARPPIESSTFTATALSLRSLQVYGTDAGEKIERARKWLETAKPVTTEDRTMQLLGMAWAKSDPKYLRESAAGLIAEQRADGGWAQLPALESDAYATGQALVALQLSGQQRGSNEASYQRGVGFLVRTQMDDGSWFVRSRSNPFQPYKESGFPYGRHQWISAAGTSWAAMALSLTQPVLENVSQNMPSKPLN